MLSGFSLLILAASARPAGSPTLPDSACCTNCSTVQIIYLFTYLKLTTLSWL